jgi:hypothetical protein
MSVLGGKSTFMIKILVRARALTRARSVTSNQLKMAVFDKSKSQNELLIQLWRIQKKLQLLGRSLPSGVI